MQGLTQTEDLSHRCIQLIRERCGVVIHELQTTLADEHVQITGIIGSWHGKQLASEAARALFPELRIHNELRVIKPR